MELEAAIMADLHEVVKAVAEEVDRRLTDKIDLYVYDYGNPLRRVYYGGARYDEWGKDFGRDVRPTYQFRDSIHAELRDLVSDYVCYEVFSDPRAMEYDPENYSHGSIQHGDLRDRMIEILNENKLSDFRYSSTGHHKFDELDGHPNIAIHGNEWWLKREPFFDYLIDELDRDIWSVFEAEMKKRGMDARREG